MSAETIGDIIAEIARYEEAGETPSSKEDFWHLGARLAAARDAAVLAEREACAVRLEARAKLIREEEFVGPREAAEALRDEAATIRARGKR